MSWFGSWFSPAKGSNTQDASLQSQPVATKTRILEEPVPQPVQKPLVEVEAPPPVLAQPVQPTRQNKNAIIFGAGATFFAVSLLITRRAFTRKRLASNPALFTNAPAHQAEQAQSVNGAVEAVEALSLATLNVFSLGLLASGGLLWYLDINSMADARRTLRGGLGVDGTGRSEKEAEEEMEEWLATTLARKEMKKEHRAMMTDRGQTR